MTASIPKQYETRTYPHSFSSTPRQLQPTSRAASRNMATNGGPSAPAHAVRLFPGPVEALQQAGAGERVGAIEGVNREHTVFGHSAHCVATHPSDQPVALAALDALVELEGPGGTRAVPVTEFYRLPQDRPEVDTVMRPGELVTGVVVPSAPEGSVSRCRKARDRAGYTVALASVAAMVHLRGVVREAALAFGGLAHRPWRARRTEAALLDTAPTAETIERAVDAEPADAVPLRHNAYKVEPARDLAREVLESLVRRPA